MLLSRHELLSYMMVMMPLLAGVLPSMVNKNQIAGPT